MSVTEVLFIVFSVLMLVSGLGVIVAKNLVYGAMSLVASFFFLAAIYALLLADTLAILQVLVYAGAIMVLFLFVIMLLSIQEKPRMGLLANLSPVRGLSILAAVVMAVALVAVTLHGPSSVHARITRVEKGMGGQYLVTLNHSPFSRMHFAEQGFGSGQVVGNASQAYSFDVVGVGQESTPVQVLSQTGGQGEPQVGQLVQFSPQATGVRPRFGTISALGALLYSRYLLPFEATSLLLLVAIVGAVVVAKGKI